MSSKYLRTALALACLLAGTPSAEAQAPADSQPRPKPKPWYERIAFRGYTQVRYNRLFETNDQLACQACDRSIGKGQGFSIRRARIVLQGSLTEDVSAKLEVDLATTSGNDLHVLQMRELYGDVILDHGRTAIARAGLAKVPFGFENLQSSSVRLPFDRSDAVNSAAPGERDVGVFALWAPASVHRRLRALVDSGYKGEGDFGVVYVGVYNGQGANRAEANDNLHVAARVAWPFELGHGQVLELGANWLHGTYTLTSNLRTAGVGGPGEFTDERWGTSLFLAPHPIGLQAEWVWGHGPRYDPALNAVAERRLKGGYVQAMVRSAVGGHPLFPFVRAQYYDGGKKNETDARSYHVEEAELGLEWLPRRSLELTAAYVFADRRFEDGAKPNNRQKGRLLRLQAQFNY